MQISQQSEQPVGSSVFPPVLAEFLRITVGMTILGYAVKLIFLLLRLPLIYQYWVFPTQYRNADMICFRPRLALDFHHPTVFSTDSAHGLMFMYPSPSALIYKAFYLIHPPFDLVVFQLFWAFCCVAVAWRFSHVLTDRGISKRLARTTMIICGLCSYPLMVNFFLGNIEIALGFLIGFGLYFFLTGRTWIAATLFGIAIACKIYPFIFLALFFSRKRYREMVYAVVLAIGVTLVSLWLVSSSLSASWAGFKVGMEKFRVDYTLPFIPWDCGIDHSLFALFKESIVALGFHYPSRVQLQPELSAYVLLTAVVGLALYFGFIRRLPMLNQVMCICVAGILLTPSSHDYTLMHLYVPFGMLVLLAIDATRKGYTVKGMRITFIVLALALGYTSELFLRGNPVTGQFKALMLIALLFLAIRFPFVSREQPSEFAPAV